MWWDRNDWYLWVMGFHWITVGTEIKNEQGTDDSASESFVEGSHGWPKWSDICT